jgi:hypothetical protein
MKVGFVPPEGGSRHMRGDATVSDISTTDHAPGLPDELAIRDATARRHPPISAP